MSTVTEEGRAWKTCPRSVEEPEPETQVAHDVNRLQLGREGERERVAVRQRKAGAVKVSTERGAKRAVAYVHDSV